MTDIITVPLTKLTAWEGNVRKTGADQGIDELAASIAAHGLLQPLVVRKAKRGKYAVIAGGRRLAALQRLAKEQRLDSDQEIACTIRSASDDDREVSLAENVLRAPMHPADQFEAFRQIIEDGATVTDVAARFGIAESTVERRLKLGRLSPVILTAYREDKIDLEQAMAFTLTDDHEAQERIYSELSGRHIAPFAIRRALTQGEVPASDKRARFAGLEAYEQAGGTIRRDLFDDENAGYLQSAGLLDQLVADKLRSLEPEIIAEGWSWTQVLPETDYGDLSHYRKLYPETLPLSDELRAELGKLQAEYDTLSESADDEGVDEDAVYEKLSEIEERIEEIEDSRPECWTTEQYALGGAIITLGSDGMPVIHRGMVRPEDERAIRNAQAVASGSVPVKPKPALPASLVQELTAQRTAAIGIELTKRPDIALAAIVHALAGQLFYTIPAPSCLQLSMEMPNPGKSIKQPESCKPLAAFDEHVTAWAERVPGDEEDLWEWCLEQPQSVLLDLLAVCAAATSDAISRKERSKSGSLEHSDALADALKFDMKNWFVVSPENYFMRVSRDQIAGAYREVKGHDVAPSWLKLKKAEFAKRVSDALADTGWLPVPLRAEPVGGSRAEEPDALCEAAE